MKMIFLIFSFILLLVAGISGCSLQPADIPLSSNAPTNSQAVPTRESVTSQPVSLNQAKPYLIVEKGSLGNEDEMRTVGLWFITAPEAGNFEEYAQTAIQATLDLYSLYRNDFTAVLLIPQRSAKTKYAEAFYAADGKGAWGMTGSAPAVPRYWHARAMDDLPYNPQELAILELWQEKQVDFPSRNPISSLSYDETGLRQYIADTLHIPYSATQVRTLKMVEYQVDESFERKPAGQEVLPNIPQSEREGTAVWPLLFQKLNTESRHFAGGLIVDLTLPEYLYFLERTVDDGQLGQSTPESQYIIPAGTGNMMKCLYPDPILTGYVQALLALP